MTISASSFRQGPPPGPRLYIYVGLGDSTNAAEGYVYTGAYNNFETYLADRADPLIALGYRWLYLDRYAGVFPTASAYNVGISPAGDPGSILQPAQCEPLTEIHHKDLVGSSYLSQLETAISARAASLYGGIAYGGSLPSSSATDDSTLDSYSTYARALNFVPGYDLSNTIDYDTPMAPPKIFGSDLKGWWSADSGVYSDAGSTAATNAGNVQQWNDRSGNGNHWIQTTAANKGTYRTSIVNGYPVVRFDGSNDFYTLGSAISLGTSFTLFVVCKTAPSIGGQCLYSSAATNNHISLNDGADNDSFGFDGTNIVGANTATTAGSFALTIHQNNAGTLRIYRSGTESAYSTGQTFSTFPFNRTGVYATGGNKWFNGDIAEMVAVNAAATANQRGLVNKYLATKYGLTAADSPTLPHKAAVLRLNATYGVRPYGEGWTRQDVAAYQGWLATQTGAIAAGIGDPAKSGLISGDAADRAYADASTYYTKPSLAAVGNRAVVLIQRSGATAAQRIAATLFWMRKGYDVVMDTGILDSGSDTLSTAQASALISAANAISAQPGGRVGRPGHIPRDRL